MKILVISSQFPNKIQSGHGLFIYELLRHQQKLNDITVISPISINPPMAIVRHSLKNFKVLVHWFKQRFSIPNSDNVNGIRVYYPKIFIFLNPLLKWTRIIPYFIRTWILARKIRHDFKFDLIHCHFAYPEGMVGVLLSKLFSLPVVVTYHGPEISRKSSILPGHLRYVVRSSDQNIIVNRNLKKYFMTNNYDHNGFIEIVNNGVDISRFFPWDKIRARKDLDLPLSRQIILYSGELGPDHGINYLIDACELLFTHNTNVLLYILGSGVLKDALLRKIGNLDLGNRIFIKESVPQEQLPGWLNAADVFVTPWLEAGLGTSLIESLACGTPVVATDIDWIEQIIPSPNLGLLAAPRDHEDLADKIQQSLQKIWNKDELVSRAKTFTWFKIAGKIQNCYEQLV